MTNFSTKLLFFHLLLLHIACLNSLASDELGNWYTLRYKTAVIDKTTLVTHAHVRLVEDLERVGQYFFSQRIEHKLYPDLQIGTGYSYLPTRRADRSFKDENRIDVEIEPQFFDGRLSFRNRYELRKLESSSSLNNRYRGRISIPYSFFGESFKASHELFLNVKTGSVNQNRFIPISYSLPIGEQSLYFAYMLQARKKQGSWDNIHNLVIGLGF